uniref:Uncharacterized protein n=1 Tax=Anopheles stephensi TaxID=30069 RepID=A0A182YGV4_ANOST
MRMQPSKHASVGDVLRVSSAPYDASSIAEMGHFIREARKLTRNNTFIGLETTKGDSNEHIHNLKESLNRWSSAENLSSDRQDRTDNSAARVGVKMATVIPIKPEQFNNGSEMGEDDGSEAKEKPPVDRRCSMIPLMCPPAGRPKPAQPQVDREKLRRKPPLPPPKVPAKHQDPIKIYRAERLQEKKLDMEQQLDDLREQIACIELSRQREDNHNREVIDLLKREVDSLKSTCDKLTDAVQRLQNADDLFLKMKHEGEFSFYSRSYEVSKKILSNTFRRRRSNTTRASCFQPSAGTSRNTDAMFPHSDQCILSDTASNSLGAIEQPGASSGGDGDHSLCRANSAPETPMNVVTSLYYVSKIQSMEMDDGAQETNETETPSLQISEKELMTKKKTRMSKIGGWFRTGRR